MTNNNLNIYTKLSELIREIITENGKHDKLSEF